MRRFRIWLCCLLLPKGCWVLDGGTDADGAYMLAGESCTLVHVPEGSEYGFHVVGEPFREGERVLHGGKTYVYRRF